MTQTLKVRGPADFLALIPALIGGVPNESVVFLLLRRDGNNGVMRVDIPAATSTAVLKRLATQVMGMLCKVPDVDAVVIAVFTSESLDTGLPHAQWADILAKRTEQVGFRIHDVLCRAGKGWGSYLDPNMPVGGHPHSEIEEAFERMPPDLNARTSEWEIPIAPDEQVERTQRELSHYRELVAALDAADNDVDKDADPDADKVADNEQCPPEFEPLIDLPLFVEAALCWSSDEIETKGSLLTFALQGPPVRDTTMLQWAYGLQLGDRLYDELGAVSPAVPFEDAGYTFGADLIMGIGPRPDHKRIQQGIELLLTLAARAEPTERRPLLCMLAWLSWALGSGTHAGRFVSLAREIDPDYGMAELLDVVITTRQLPDWTFTPPAKERDAL